LWGVLDAYSRKAVGCGPLIGSADAALVNSALNMAAATRSTTLETIIHADHGAQGEFNWSSQHPEVLERLEMFDGGNSGMEQEDQRCSQECAATVACKPSFLTVNHGLPLLS
jgi:hypothetical protein